MRGAGTPCAPRTFPSLAGGWQWGWAQGSGGWSPPPSPPTWGDQAGHGDPGKAPGRSHCCEPHSTLVVPGHQPSPAVLEVTRVSTQQGGRRCQPVPVSPQAMVIPVARLVPKQGYAHPSACSPPSACAWGHAQWGGGGADLAPPRHQDPAQLHAVAHRGGAE